MKLYNTLLENIPAKFERFTVEWEDSTHVTLRWIVQQKYRDHISHFIIGIHDETHNLETTTVMLPNKRFEHFKTISGHRYNFYLLGIMYLPIPNAIWKVTLCKSTENDYKAIYSQAELLLLMTRAATFVLHAEPKYAPLLYRCKPTEYFSAIKRRAGMVMHPYMKDNNGDQANPINNNICGLFFNAWLTDDGEMPGTSPFGAMRFIIPIERLVHQHSRLYFADFYCLGKPHYITVVVCSPGSAADVYCERFLWPLDIYNNPFLFFNKYDNSMYIGEGCWIEIFITDAVDLRYEMQLDVRCRFDIIPTRGKGSSRLDGLPKNIFCTVCNVYPPVVDEFMKKLAVSKPPAKPANTPKATKTVAKSHGVKRAASEMSSPVEMPQKVARVDKRDTMKELDLVLCNLSAAIEETPGGKISPALVGVDGCETGTTDVQLSNSNDEDYLRATSANQIVKQIPTKMTKNDEQDKEHDEQIKTPRVDSPTQIAMILPDENNNIVPKKKL